jgi:hypothetical protein
LSLSLSASLQLVAYLTILRRRMGARLGLQELAVPLLKLLAAAIPAAALAVVICSAGAWDRGPASLANWVLLLLAGIAAGAAYLGIAWSLDVKALRALLRRIRGARSS